MITYICSTAKNSSDKDFMLWLYEKFYKLMFATAKKYTDNQDICEDIVQDSLIRLIDKRNVLKGKDRRVIASYIVCTTRNTVINYLKQQNSQKKHTVSFEEHMLDDLEAHTVPLDELVQQKETVENLLFVLEQLTETDRVVLEGKYILEYTDRELAEQLHCKPDSIRMKLTRARRNALTLLTQKYKDYDEAPGTPEATGR